MAEAKAAQLPVRVGIRELKAHLSERLRQVKEGQVLVITEHGRAVARIIPERLTDRERIEQMVASGNWRWSGRRYQPLQDRVPTLDGGSVADLIIEDKG